VVIAGLIAVSIGELIKNSNPGLASWLFRADAIAALGVSGIVIYVSVQMGRRSISTLLDSTPQGINATVERAVASLPGVLAVDRIRSRQSGPSIFVDMTLAVARTASLEESHSIASSAESIVQKLLPRSDVMVHIDPVARDNNSLVERVHSVAGKQGISVHGLHMHDVRGNLSLELHAEVPDNLSVNQAHEQVTRLEKVLVSKFRNSRKSWLILSRLVITRYLNLLCRPAQTRFSRPLFVYRRRYWILRNVTASVFYAVAKMCLSPFTV
jgi:divalent metal cation (Fe/Co/Zn/Cd) transporter